MLKAERQTGGGGVEGCGTEGDRQMVATTNSRRRDNKG